MTESVATVQLQSEADALLARQRAREIAALLGLARDRRLPFAAAVWEMARNAVVHGGGGQAEYLVRVGEPQPVLMVRVSDRGRGMTDVAAWLKEPPPGEERAGRRLRLARRAVDEFHLESAPGEGTVVTLAVNLPVEGAPGRAEEVARVREQVEASPLDTLLEAQHRSDDVSYLLEEVAARQAELEQVSRELDDTNRGVVALYAELDERAVYLQRANQLKDRFLRNVSHELRTPLNSVLALSHLLLSRADGELTPEQERQVQLIQQAARDLNDFVNDLLDLARVEAGRVTVQPSEFTLGELFAGLRGMFRPLATNPRVALVIEEPPQTPVLHTDEAKVGQVLRNFVSNALKFTEQGEVRVSAKVSNGDRVMFEVRDTGIGIAAEDRERIFEEFGQVESPVRGRAKGAGLGLPLSKRLAELLGGEVGVESEPGVGSAFYAVIPCRYEGPTERLEEEVAGPPPGVRTQGRRKARDHAEARTRDHSER